MAEGSMASLMVIVGPLILIAVLAWVVMNNRRSRSQDARTEEATRKLYDEQDRIDKANEVR